MAKLFTKRFKDYLYDLENLVDEFVIVFLSLGAIFVTLWTLVVGTANYNLVEFGSKIVWPWFGTLAVMIIARELWLLNRNLDRYFKEEGE
ncbi:MAG: hypothetical protein ABEJ87_05905 [Candidatus Nanohalobium sp.]